MAVARAPLFLGLTRPARYAGLPVAYFAIWGGGSTILFIIFETIWIWLAAGIAYLILRVLAEREPAYIEITAAILKATPPTRNRRVWGGDAYDA